MIQAIPTVLISSQFVPNSQTTVYTSPAGGPTGITTIVDSLDVCNNTGGGVTFSLNIVPSGSSATTSNLVVKTLSVGAGATVKIIGIDSGAQLGPKILAPGDFLSVIAGAASSLEIHAGGRQCS